MATHYTAFAHDLEKVLSVETVIIKYSLRTFGRIFNIHLRIVFLLKVVI